MRARAVLVARPLTEVEHELSRLLLILALIGGGGIVLMATADYLANSGTIVVSGG